MKEIHLKHTQKDNWKCNPWIMSSEKENSITDAFNPFFEISRCDKMQSGVCALNEHICVTYQRQP